MDTITPQERSALMARIRGKNTKPELTVRSLLHRMGYRFRLHRHDLPGSPDIVFPARSKVIFIHGCFWHGHAGCGRARIPKERSAYWTNKIARNRTRDTSALRRLRRLGWGALVLWECQLRDQTKLSTKIRRFLDVPPRQQRRSS